MRTHQLFAVECNGRTGEKPTGRTPVAVFKRATVVVASLSLTCLALAAASYAAGARVNTTKSIPLGLYWTSSAPVEKGAYVLFCPPKQSAFDAAKKRGYIGSGFCVGNYGYMMKRVLAAKSDVVDVTAEGVRINGELAPLSAPIKADKAGQILPRYKADHYTLGASDLLLMGDVNPLSFDSRYFGPIDRSQIKTVIRPVVTW